MKQWIGNIAPETPDEERVSLRLHGMYWKNRALMVQTMLR